jgi:hypothetical protein
MFPPALLLGCGPLAAPAPDLEAPAVPDDFPYLLCFDAFIDILIFEIII